MSTDERRERYAAAISAKTAWHGGTDLQEQADAAMAVADAEISAYENARREWAAGALAENARLHAELDTANKIASLNQRLYTNAVATIRRVRTILDTEELFSDEPLGDRIRDALNGENR